MQLERPDLLVDHGVVVADDALLRVAKEECGVALVIPGGEALPGLGPDLGQFRVDLRCGDVAVRHVHEVETRALLEKADGDGLAGGLLLAPGAEMRRDL